MFRITSFSVENDYPSKTSVFIWLDCAEFFYLPFRVVAPLGIPSVVFYRGSGRGIGHDRIKMTDANAHRDLT